jgi:ribosomal protein S12 methylthiotransferase accessory factor YcaO
MFGREVDSSKISDLVNDLNKVKQTVKSMETRIEKQAAVIRALWEMLQDKLKVSDGEIMASVVRIQQDRQEQDNQNCSSCSRPLKAKSRKCLYCGTELPITSLFDMI